MTDHEGGRAILSRLAHLWTGRRGAIRGTGA